MYKSSSIEGINTIFLTGLFFMNPIHQIQTAFIHHLITFFKLTPHDAHAFGMLSINDSELKSHQGDLSSTCALQLSRYLSRNPRDIARDIAESFSHRAIERTECVNPGFLNFYLTHEAFAALASFFYTHQDRAFKPAALQRRNYSIEFVSANPTGPLHFGHGRGGIIGDVLGNILSFLGHTVTKEFYINDAGAQITKLGLSLRARCLQQLGKDVPMPEDGYHGDYLVQIAQDLVAQKTPEQIETADVSFFSCYAQAKLLDSIEKTLSRYGIRYDVWFSEKILHDSGAITRVLDQLRAAGYVYEKEGALWFEATRFGDDKDRVVARSTGELTYVAADIAYLCNKVERGNNELVMVLGQDHHGYAARLYAALKAVKLDNQAILSTILYQLVRMTHEQEYIKMSKRAGMIVTLDDVVDRVGTDIARFFYLYRKADAHLDFDLALAVTHSDENPVYYIQYALVRTKSILHKARQNTVFASLSAADLASIGPSETLVLKKIAHLEYVLASVAKNHQTHVLAYYTHELAQIFNRYYGNHTVINPAEVSQSRARLCTVSLVESTLTLLLRLLGITAPEHM